MVAIWQEENKNNNKNSNCNCDCNNPYKDRKPIGWVEKRPNPTTNDSWAPRIGYKPPNSIATSTTSGNGGPRKHGHHSPNKPSLLMMVCIHVSTSVPPYLHRPSLLTLTSSINFLVCCTEHHIHSCS